MKAWRKIAKKRKKVVLEHVLSATLRLKWGNMRIWTCIWGQSWWCVGIWSWRNKRKVIPTKLAFTFQEVGKCFFLTLARKKPWVCQTVLQHEEDLVSEVARTGPHSNAAIPLGGKSENPSSNIRSRRVLFDVFESHRSEPTAPWAPWPPPQRFLRENSKKTLEHTWNRKKNTCL